MNEPAVTIKEEELKMADAKAPPGDNDGFGSGEQGTQKRVIIPRIIPSPTHVFTSNIERSRAPSLRWESPEWDLAECGRILDTESYVRRAFRNKKNLFLKEGYDFVGAKPERVRYIKRRMKQMEAATGTPFGTLISQTAWALIRTSNAFWVKVRDEKASGGRVRKNANGKALKPVAGYFIMAPETVRFKRDGYGRLVKYMQDVYGKTPLEFAPEDVIHFYFDKREGFSVGTPVLASVKDDIRALRRIEENVELLVYQHLFPLFHYKVGTEKDPAKIYPDGTDEVREVQMKIAMMPSDGCWVTPERHSIEAINASGSAVAVDKVIEHFKQRIFSGLGNSSVDMGEGNTSNKGTAVTMSRNLIDDTKADQKEFACQFEANIIEELMLESTFSNGTIFDDENEVYLRFNEIDLEARQAKENHLVDIFLKNAITHDELRTGMGYEPFAGDGWPTANSKSKMFVKSEGDFARTNYGLFDRDKTILQSIDEPGTDAAKAASKSSGGGSVGNKNKPANQHGTRPAAKVNKDSFGHGSDIPSMRIVFAQGAPLLSMYDMMATDIEGRIRRYGYSAKEIRLLIDSAFGQGKERLASMALTSARAGIQDSEANLWDINLTAMDGRISDHIGKYIDKLHGEVVSHVQRNGIQAKSLANECAVLIGLALGALRHRTLMIDNSEVMRAYNYGKALGHQVLGFDKLVSKRHGEESCRVCDKLALAYETMDAIIYEELPPLHPHCTCTMEPA